MFTHIHKSVTWSSVYVPKYCFATMFRSYVFGDASQKSKHFLGLCQLLKNRNYSTTVNLNYIAI